MTYGDLLFFLSYKIYSSHLCFVSISFDHVLAKSVEISSLFILLPRAPLKRLQLMRMRCWTKRWASNIYYIGRLTFWILAINWEFFLQSVIFAKFIRLTLQEDWFKLRKTVISWYLGKISFSASLMLKKRSHTFCCFEQLMDPCNCLENLSTSSSSIM